MVSTVIMLPGVSFVISLNSALDNIVSLRYWQ